MRLTEPARWALLIAGIAVVAALSWIGYTRTETYRLEQDLDRVVDEYQSFGSLVKEKSGERETVEIQREDGSIETVVIEKK